MEKQISDFNSVLVVDHELLQDVKIPNQKQRVKSLKDARRSLFEETFNAIVFLSLLEESNEIEIFVKGLRSHPTLKVIPIFCEYGLTLALPQDLGLLTFQESDLQESEQEEDFNEYEETEEKVPAPIVDIKSFLQELKELTAKSYVLFESNVEEHKSRQEMISDYFAVLKSEIK